jgi:6-phosphofructokinase 2
MSEIATLTMNPTIDVSYEVDRVFHTHKMRTRAEHYAPGGGGINVARVIARLGGTARCYYLSGGATGPAFDGLVDQHRLVRTRIPIAEPTRIATAVLERESGREYRFTPQGPFVSETEWGEVLGLLEDARCSMFVASGSLPQGVPADFYARIGRILSLRGIPFVLDTSGPALRETLAAGGVLLVKPSLGELRQLIGSDVETVEDIMVAARGIVESGSARIVAVTMGHRGGVLVHEGGSLFLPAPKVEAQSAVGAGDSFVAAMVHSLAQGSPVEDAFRRGMAAGAAAVLTPGTGLAHPADIARLYGQMNPA